MFKSINLFPSQAEAVEVDNVPVMGETISYTGNAFRGAGWYGPTTGLHTVAIQVQNFRGRISIQGALATTPGDSDWFSVLPGGVPYIEYPRFGYVVKSPATGETSIYGFNFMSNVVWVRATMDRSYIIPSLAQPMFIASFGSVNYILLNY